MAKVENFDAPIGWLIDPHNKWAINFNFKKCTNNDNAADSTIDMWGVDPSGKHMQFKSRRKVTKEESLKTWKQLLSSNWVEFDYEMNKRA